MPLHSSLGNKNKTLSKKEIKKKERRREERGGEGRGGKGREEGINYNGDLW